jgi:hypothetical protein
MNKLLLSIRTFLFQFAGARHTEQDTVIPLKSQAGVFLVCLPSTDSVLVSATSREPMPTMREAKALDIASNGRDASSLFIPSPILSTIRKLFHIPHSCQRDSGLHSGIIRMANLSVYISFLLTI